MHIETIIHQGKKVAVLPVSTVRKLLADAQELADIRAFDVAKQRLKAKKDELIPLALAERRLAGENSLRIWREFRKVTQAKLAQLSGVSREMIAAIEAGHKKGGVQTVNKIARALDVSIEQLIE